MSKAEGENITIDSCAPVAPFHDSEELEKLRIAASNEMDQLQLSQSTEPAFAEAGASDERLLGRASDRASREVRLLLKKQVIDDSRCLRRGCDGAFCSTKTLRLIAVCACKQDGSIGLSMNDCNRVTEVSVCPCY